MHRVDSHCHLWDLARGDYDWMDVNDPAMAPIARDFQFDDIAPLLTDANINEAILVQAAATTEETDFLLSIAENHTEFSGVVGWANIEFDSANAVLEGWTNHDKFKGIRPMLQDIDKSDWLLTAPKPSIWKSMVDLDLRFDALVQPRHLPMLYQFCKSNENLPIVIDHVAKPKDALAGNKQAFNAWEYDIARIGDETHAYCKLSGLFTELSVDAMQNPVEAIEPVFDTLLKHFGPSRLMWGSDWPVLTLASSYEEWDAAASQLLNQLSNDEKACILGSTAVQFYGLGASE